VARFELTLVAALAFGTFSAVAKAQTYEPEPRGMDANAVPPGPPVGMFLDLEWRVMGVGAHVSHGAAFAVGAAFFDGALRVGVGGLSRPGPFNPKTFDVTVPDGRTYKGKSVLSLRNDGGMAGLHVGLSVDTPLEGFAVHLPVTVGYGGFGYYLSGRDRETPDGRRVSEWEYELFDGQDSHLGVVVDVGLRIRYRAKLLPWFSPYAGAAYTLVPGFRTIVRDDYAGFSAVLGVEVGLGI
jgi:hypothetical protein